MYCDVVTPYVTHVLQVVELARVHIDQIERHVGGSAMSCIAKREPAQSARSGIVSVFQACCQLQLLHLAQPRALLDSLHPAQPARCYPAARAPERGMATLVAPNKMSDAQSSGPGLHQALATNYAVSARARYTRVRAVCSFVGKFLLREWQVWDRLGILQGAGVFDDLFDDGVGPP
jgi:hypothetical protein